MPSRGMISVDHGASPPHLTNAVTMSYARHFMTTRASLAALLLGLLLLVGLWQQAGTEETVSQTVQGKVLSAGDQTTGTQALPTLLVELDDGRQVRLLHTGRQWQAGESVQLRRSISNHGTESYQLLDGQ